LKIRPVGAPASHRSSLLPFSAGRGPSRGVGMEFSNRPKRFAQLEERDPSAVKQRVPVEPTQRTAFPAIAAKPCSLTLGPPAFFWLSLESKLAAAEFHPPVGCSPRSLTRSGDWPQVFTGKSKA
jgi:hypothetical protein